MKACDFHSVKLSHAWLKAISGKKNDLLGLLVSVSGHVAIRPKTVATARAQICQLVHVRH